MAPAADWARLAKARYPAELFSSFSEGFIPHGGGTRASCDGLTLDFLYLLGLHHQLLAFSYHLLI